MLFMTDALTFHHEVGRDMQQWSRRQVLAGFTFALDLAAERRSP
jgi:hypothetical protein